MGPDKTVIHFPCHPQKLILLQSSWSFYLCRLVELLAPASFISRGFPQKDLLWVEDFFASSSQNSLPFSKSSCGNSASRNGWRYHGVVFWLDVFYLANGPNQSPPEAFLCSLGLHSNIPPLLSSSSLLRAAHKVSGSTTLCSVLAPALYFPIILQLCWLNW